MSEYTAQTTYTIRNISGKPLRLTSFIILINHEEYGYLAKGWYTATINDVVVAQKTKADDPNGYLGGSTYAYEGSLQGAALGVGESLTLEVDVLFYKPFGDWNITPAGLQVTSSNPDMQGRINLSVAEDTTQTGGGVPIGGGDGSGGAVEADGAAVASPSGITYRVTPAMGVVARVTRWAYPPLFGVKRLIPPPPPPQLYYPTTWGPIVEGEIDGLFITPGILTGYRLEDGSLTTIEASGTRFRLSSPENGSTVRFGIMPFKEGDA